MRKVCKIGFGTCDRTPCTGKGHRCASRQLQLPAAATPEGNAILVIKFSSELRHVRAGNERSQCYTGNFEIIAIRSSAKETAKKCQFYFNISYS